MVKNLDMRNKLNEFYRQNPDTTQAEAAKVFSVSTGRIGQLCRELNLRPRRLGSGSSDKFPERFTGSEDNKRDRPDFFNRYSGNHNNKNFIGDTSEAVCVADLMRRGFLVFINSSNVGPYDLVVSVKRELFKVEVKSAKYVGCKVVGSPPTNSEYDILATVTPDGVCHYKIVDGVTVDLDCYKYSANSS